MLLLRCDEAATSKKPYLYGVENDHGDGSEGGDPPLELITGMYRQSRPITPKFLVGLISFDRRKILGYVGPLTQGKLNKTAMIPGFKRCVIVLALPRKPPTRLFIRYTPANEKQNDKSIDVMADLRFDVGFPRKMKSYM